MNDKLRTKVLTLIIAVVISIFLSIIISWVLVQIFTKQPENIFKFNNFNILGMFSILKLEEGKQIFLLVLLCFILLLAFTVFRVFNLDDYLAKTYKVTKEIRIPLPIGKDQTQNGSSWWLNKKKFPSIFGVNIFDSENETIAHLLNCAEEEREKEKYLMEHQDKIIPGENKITRTVEPIFEKGGLVVGKEDKNIYTPYIKKFKNTIPYISFSKRKVEKIYFVKDDMHSLTVGATRSRKNSL